MQLPQISGMIIHGDKVGRTIGFPTANFDTKDFPAEVALGVYVVRSMIDKKPFFGLAYFGPRYVHGQQQNSFEVFYYDFDGDLYDKELKAELLAYVRPPLKLENLDEVKTQLEKDKAAAAKILSLLPIFISI
jgi:riboflavin kinase / FMN adenylyltransferase